MSGIEQDRAGGVAVPLPRSAHGRLVARPWLATGLIALTASTFALGSTLIRFAYDAGAGTLTIVMTRTTVAAVGLALVLGVARTPLRFDRRERWAAPLIGLFMAGYSGAFYMGMEYMPVALTVVTFYTYPLLTGLFGWLTGQERFGATGLVALPLAFFGLVLALDVSGGSFSLVGASWAMLGALGFSAVLILSGLLLPRRSDTRPRTLVMLATASVACIVVTLASGEIWFPTTALGWAGLMGSALCYAVAMTSILFFAAVLGATRVAVVMNVEPIASLVLTFLILGERLRPTQLVGVLFVVAAIFLFRPRRAPVRA
ncbi:MAG TPA: DMT family transporter [Stellaceae bacterium]|nr:DMT family transporter [Stellaceae bacterium]